jgi:hypothetical protein
MNTICYTFHMNKTWSADMTVKMVDIPINHLKFEREVLRKALLKACQILEITSQEFADLIGIRGASYSRFIGNAQDEYFIDPNSKTGEIAIMFLKIYKSLFALLGGDAKSCSIWLRSMNKSLGYIPIKLMSSVQGMANVLYYLERIKG